MAPARSFDSAGLSQATVAVFVSRRDADHGLRRFQGAFGVLGIDAPLIEAGPAVEHGGRVGQNLPHLGYRPFAVALLGGNPRHAGPQLHGRILAEDRGMASRIGILPALGSSQAAGPQVVGVDAFRVEFQGLVQGRQAAVVLVGLVVCLGGDQPGAGLAAALLRKGQGCLQGHIAAVHFASPAVHAFPGPFVARLQIRPPGGPVPGRPPFSPNCQSVSASMTWLAASRGANVASCSRRLARP